MAITFEFIRSFLKIFGAPCIYTYIFTRLHGEDHERACYNPIGVFCVYVI